MGSAGRVTSTYKDSENGLDALVKKGVTPSPVVVLSLRWRAR